MNDGLNFNAKISEKVDSSVKNIKNSKTKEAKKDESIFTEDEEKSYENSSEYKRKKELLMEDFEYFTNLKSQIEDGDLESAQEAENIELGQKISETNSNAAQYNKNVTLLATIKSFVKSVFENDKKEDELEVDIDTKSQEEDE